MKSKTIIKGLSILTSMILLGCGGGSSDGTSTGTFIDAEVIGAEYETTSGITGVTDSQGHFEYKRGDKVKFKLGNLLLGEAEPNPEGLITPTELAGDDSETQVLLLQVLQALDEDNDPSNGITIPEDVVASLEAISETDIHNLDETSLLNLDTTLRYHLDEDHDGVVDVDPLTAQEHFQLSLNEWHAEHDQSTNIGQGNGNGYKYGQSDEEPTQTGPVIDVNSYAMYTLTQDIKDELAYMGNEERLAYDVYKNLYEYHLNLGSDLTTLNNVAERSEQRHIATVRALVDKYDLNSTDFTNLDRDIVGDSSTDIDSVRGEYDIQHIQDLYEALYNMGIQSAEDALKVGCMVEVTDINDLDEKITDAQEIYAKDVEDAFTALRQGSYNHYWAFDQALKDRGVTEGCCSLGTIDGVNYCHPEYPQNTHGQH